MKFLKLFELPHVSTYKWRWLRRVMIVVTFPQEAARAIYQTYGFAKLWWNAPAVLPPPPSPQ